MNAKLIFEWILRLGLGGLFIYAGVVKVADPETFFWDVHHYELTPWDVSMVVSFLLPWVEILAGAALILRRFYAGGMLLTALMSAIFLGAIGSAWARGLDITCGCFGKEANATNFAQHIAMNAGMLTVAVVLWWMANRRSAAEISVRANS